MLYAHIQEANNKKLNPRPGAGPAEAGLLFIPAEPDHEGFAN